MRITLVDEQGIDAWKESLKLVYDDSDRYYGGKQYVRGRDACGDFTRRELHIAEYEVRGDTQVSELIYRHVGERPRSYTRDELQASLSEVLYGEALDRETRSGDLMEDAERLAKDMPSVFLVKAHDSSRSGRGIWSGSLDEAHIQDGAVLLVRRSSRRLVLKRAWRLRLLARMGPVPHPREFFDAISSRSTGPERARRHDWRYKERFSRPARIGLLYTDEDADVASYVRTHYHELDIASGDSCDLYFIENPGSIEPVRYWRPLLGAKLHAAWKLLGWANSAPYDKAGVYEIAQQLGVRIDQLPCAVVFAPASNEVAEVVPLKGNLTSTLRGLLARFQDSSGAAPHAESVGTGAGAGEPVVFLSHASADKAIVRSVAVQLQSYGIETWFDERQIRAGDSLTRQIESGLARAEVVVLFLSRSSLASAWVDAEMRAALHAQIDKRQYRALIPVVLDDCEIPALLCDYRRIVASEPALIVEELRAAVNGLAPVRS